MNAERETQTAQESEDSVSATAVYISNFISPFKALYRAHILLVIYLAAMLSLVYFLSNKIISILLDYLILISAEVSLPEATEDLAYYGVFIFVWCVTAPVIVVAFSLPVNSLWVQGKFNLFRAIADTPSSISKAYYCISQILGPSLYILIAPISMIAIYFLHFQYVEETSYHSTYVACCAVVCLIGFVKALPFLLSPIVSIAAQLVPQEAITASVEILKDKIFPLAFIIIFGLALSWGGLELVPYFELKPSSTLISQIAIILFCMWYTITILCVMILYYLTSYQQAQEQAAHQKYYNQQAYLASRMHVMQPGTVNAYINNFRAN